MFRCGISAWTMVLRRFATPAIAVAAFGAAVSSNAQDMVQAGATADAQLVAAERALLEGLSANGVSAFESSAPVSKSSSRKSAPKAKGSQKSSRDISQKPPSPGSATVPESDPASSHVKTRDNESAPPQSATELVKTAPQESSPPVVSEVKMANSAERSAENETLRRNLDASQRRVAELERKLEEVRGQLSMAETELSRLASISEAKSRASLGRMNINPPPASPQSSVATTKHVVPPAAAPVAREAVSPPIEPTPSAADLMIVTVAVDKAELRLGPGTNHSSLMTVARGSRLAVEARQGEWYRVFAPNGQRAWVLSRLVTVGDKKHARDSTSAVRVRGYSNALEDEAFRRIQSLTAER